MAGKPNGPCWAIYFVASKAQVQPVKCAAPDTTLLLAFGDGMERFPSQSIHLKRFTKLSNSLRALSSPLLISLSLLLSICNTSHISNIQSQILNILHGI